VKYLLILLFPLTVHAQEPDVNIYQSKTDKTKVVVEYIREDGKEFRLLMKEKDLETKYDEVEKWVLSRRLE
jgi:hypothetical protein